MPATPLAERTFTVGTCEAGNENCGTTQVKTSVQDVNLVTGQLIVATACYSFRVILQEAPTQGRN
jgi:hypothetical protein